MSSHNGQFVWYELATSDATGARAFYQAVIGWNAQDGGTPDWPYTLLSAGQTQVGGLMPLPQEACDRGARPSWRGYVAVHDVDYFAERVAHAGGTIHKAAADIENVGRFAIVADPQGAAFVLFKGQPDQAPPTPAPGTPGHFGWHELHARDHASAFTFYNHLFGWTAGEGVDMGPLGIYQLFANGAEPIGGMMNKADEVPAPFWLYYINVDDIEAGASRVKEHGGQVINGPHPVPGGSWIAQCQDPQGALFALVEPMKL